MNVDVLFTLNEPIRNNSNAVIVIVDVLRATTSMTVAIENGCKEVITFSSIEESLEFASTLNSDEYILAGERRGYKPLGFDIGNSPEEFSKDLVFKKKVIITTTNGTVAINKCKDYQNVILGCFLNASAVLEHCITSKQDVVIMCSGHDGRFCMEDVLFAGFLASNLLTVGAELTDSASVAAMFYNDNAKDIESALKNSDHGKYLCENGYHDDVIFCAQMSKIDVVPYVCGNVVRC